MLEKKDMKKGLIIWWVAERIMSGWSCPAVITHVGRKSFRVISLDDFKESGELRMNDEADQSSRHEMRVSSLEEVKEYFKKRERQFDDLIQKKKRDLADAEENLRDFKERARKFISER